MKVNETLKNTQEITLELSLSVEEFDNLFTYCEDCGKIIFKNNAINLDDEYFCEECVTVCDCCGDTIRRSQVYMTEDSEYYYCKDCFDNETHVCDDCGSFIERRKT